MRKCRKRLILGETISIIYFSLDHLLFQNIVQTCTHTCVRYLRSHEEAYSQSTHQVKNFISNSSHRRHTSYIEELYSLLLFICNQKYSRIISSQKEGCQTFNGDVNVYLKEHLELCSDSSYIIHLKFQN